MESLKEKWEALDPGMKQKMVIIGAIAGLIMIVSLFMQPPEKKDRSMVGREKLEVTNILTDIDPRELGMESLKTQVNDLRALNNQQQDEMKRLKREAEQAEEIRKRADIARDKQFKELMKQLDQTMKELKEVKSSPAYQAGTGQVVTEGGAAAQGSEPVVIVREPEPAVKDMFASSDNTVEDSFQQSTVDAGDADSDLRADIREIVDENANLGADGEEELPEIRHLPSGSILQGVLLTGLDAPAEASGSSDEHPVLIRIKKDAILPNRRTSDIRECFVTASGHGDLSTERAFLRAENISCVTNDGGVIEKALNAYAVGEDAKLGLRGRVVSKQSAILARSLWASFLQGWAQSFSKSDLPEFQFNTDAGGYDKLRDAVSSSRIADAGIMGTANAVDRLAQFYIDMADSMVPVIEIDAGRSIALVVTSGTQLRMSKAATPEKNEKK